jgi:hypothetical protein
MTFTVKVRGAGGLMLAEYRCPQHGVFEVLVSRGANGEPPAEAKCPAACRSFQFPRQPIACEQPSPWTISAPAVHTQFVITASRGRSDPKPHAKAMDTRMLAEGRKNEFRRQRKKIREDERHARVKELLR